MTDTFLGCPIVVAPNQPKDLIRFVREDGKEVGRIENIGPDYSVKFAQPDPKPDLSLFDLDLRSIEERVIASMIARAPGPIAHASFVRNDDELERDHLAPVRITGTLHCYFDNMTLYRDTVGRMNEAIRLANTSYLRLVDRWLAASGNRKDRKTWAKSRRRERAQSRRSIARYQRGYRGRGTF